MGNAVSIIRSNIASAATGPHEKTQNDDMRVIDSFLDEYNSTPSTRRAYAKEITRFMMWVKVCMGGMSIAQMSKDEIKAYVRFMIDPQPRDAWCGKKCSREDPRWKPFEGPLGAVSIRTALAILQCLFTYASNLGYVKGNAVKLVRLSDIVKQQKTKQQARRERILNGVQMDAISKHLNQDVSLMTESERFAIERQRFLFSCLLFLSLRIGEIKDITMGDFGHTRHGWFLSVIGKGHKPSEIPLVPQMVDALVRYRRCLGLPDFPSKNEETPIITSVDKRSRIATRTLSAIFNEIIKGAMYFLGFDDSKAIAKASPHWVRHTSISTMVDSGVPLHQVKENARHANLDTTLIYVHSTEEEKMQSLLKVKWQSI